MCPLLEAGTEGAHGVFWAVMVRGQRSTRSEEPARGPVLGPSLSCSVVCGSEGF